MTDNDGDAENLRTLWALGTEDIRFFKSQQYSVTNYALALMAGMVALRAQFDLPHTLSGPSIVGRILFAVLALVIACGGWQQIDSLQRSMDAARERADAARDALAGLGGESVRS
jgi:hypothetical protein